MRYVLAAALTAAFVLPASPASATCMETYNNETLGIRSGSCAPPGGPVTSYFCVLDVCWTHTAGDPPPDGS